MSRYEVFNLQEIYKKTLDNEKLADDRLKPFATESFAQTIHQLHKGITKIDRLAISRSHYRV